MAVPLLDPSCRMSAWFVVHTNVLVTSSVLAYFSTRGCPFTSMVVISVTFTVW